MGLGVLGWGRGPRDGSGGPGLGVRVPGLDIEVLGWESGSHGWVWGSWAGVRVLGMGLGVGVPAPKPASFLSWPALTYPRVTIPATATVAGLTEVVAALDPTHPLALRY